MSSGGDPELTGLEPQTKPVYGSTDPVKEDDDKSPSVTLNISSPNFGSFRTANTSSFISHDFRIPTYGPKPGVDEEKSGNGMLHCAAVWMSLLIGSFGVLGLKVAAFSISGSQMVKTTMFGSCGDALSGAIIILTQRNSRRNDVTKFPAGKGRFEPLGILVFSVFMTALMATQVMTACWHVAAVDERDAAAGMLMLWKGHPSNVYTPTPFSGAAAAYSALQEAVNKMPEEDRKKFVEQTQGVDWKFVEMPDAERETAIGNVIGDIGELVELGDIGNLAQRFKVVLMLLASVLLIKAALGCFCCFYVYPRTKSFLINVLAHDHFYDAVAQFFVISVITILFVWKGQLGWMETRFDGLCSIIYAASIIARWVVVVLEQLTFLSGYSADASYYEDIARAASFTLKSESAKFELDAVKAYHFGRRHLVELDIVVPGSSTSFEKVREVVDSLKEKVVAEVDDVEKVFVNVASDRGSYSNS